MIIRADESYLRINASPRIDVHDNWSHGETMSVKHMLSTKLWRAYVRRTHNVVRVRTHAAYNSSLTRHARNIVEDGEIT